MLSFLLTLRRKVISLSGAWASLSLLLTASQMVAGETGSSNSFQCTSPLEKSRIYVFSPTPMVSWQEVPRILNTRTLYKKCHSLSVYLCGMKHPRCPHTCYSLTAYMGTAYFDSCHSCLGLHSDLCLCFKAEITAMPNHTPMPSLHFSFYCPFLNPYAWRVHLPVTPLRHFLSWFTPRALQNPECLNHGPPPPFRNSMPWIPLSSVLVFFCGVFLVCNSFLGKIS